ncbi:MAG: hypothetical protein ACQESG_06545 [Nanobdellota archaeon]
MKWVCMLLLLSVMVAADFTSSDVLLINSENWQDVYSGILAARLSGKEVFFVRGPDSVNSLFDRLPEKEILLLQSDEPVYPGLESLIRTNGFTYDTFPEDDMNANLFEELEIQDAIVIDGAYGYDAMSVAPYALQNEAYVVFEDEVPQDANIIMTYGFVDDIDAPVRIDNGNRFDNNMEIIDRFIANKPTKSVKISNGEFIEKSLFNKEFPLLFIGKSNVPSSVENYLLESDFTIATLVGNDLAPLAKNLKDRLKNQGKTLTVIALIGKSGSGGSNSIQSLDTFSIPAYDARLGISSIRYNQLSQQLEVTYQNENDLRVYFLPTITLNIGDEKETLSSNLQFLDGDHSKTISYPVEITDESVSGRISVLFGRANNSLERRLDYPFDSLPMVEVLDSSNISIEKAVYDRLNKAFKIKVKNRGSVQAYVDIELIDVIVDGEETILTPRQTKSLSAGASGEVIVRADLSSVDLGENTQVNVKAYYGQQEGILFKTTTVRLPLEITMNPGFYAAAVVVVVIIIVFLSLRKKRRRIEN